MRLVRILLRRGGGKFSTIDFILHLAIAYLYPPRNTIPFTGADAEGKAIRELAKGESFGSVLSLTPACNLTDIDFDT